MKSFRSKLSYANVVATLALFVALGTGGAWAASKLHKNSVGTAQIKANAVTGAKVKDDSITGSDIVESTLAQVPSAADSTKLGGAAASAYQSRIAAGCASGSAISQVGADGTVSCQAVPKIATPFVARINGLSGSASGYGPVSGSETYSPAEGPVQQVTPPIPLTASSLSATGDGQNGIVTLRVNGVNTALTCTFTGGSCTDTTHSVQIPASSNVSFFVQNASGTGLSARVGWVATG